MYEENTKVHYILHSNQLFYLYRQQPFPSSALFFDLNPSNKCSIVNYSEKSDKTPTTDHYQEPITYILEI